MARTRLQSQPKPLGPLDELLATWRANPTPAFAALVARAGKLAARDRDAITGTNHAELHKSWLAIEKQGDPADLDRLLATLTAGRCEAAIARLGKLAKRPRDPRVLETLVTIIEADPRLRRGETSPVPFTSDPNRPFWTALLAMVAGQGDAAISPRLRATAKRKTQTKFEAWLAGKLATMATALDARPIATLTAKELVAAARFESELARDEAVAKPGADLGAALYAAVWAAPDDDAPRTVLADFLSERNDPRGEFIALQLVRHAGALDAAGKKREKELLKRHKKQWLGPIAPLIQPHNMRFERGFLVTCQLEPNAELEKTLGTHPAWSTIREYLVHAYAARTGSKLVAMLKKHGATAIDQRFTRGIE